MSTTNIDGPVSAHLPETFIKAVRRRFGKSGEAALRSLEQQARSQFRPALDLLKERMALVDALQQAATEELLANPDGLTALLDSYADTPSITAWSKAKNTAAENHQPLYEAPEDRRARAIRVMDEIVRSIATAILPYQAPRLSANKNMNVTVDAEIAGMSDDDLDKEYKLAVQREALRLVDPGMFENEEKV
jgi:hypothetical protein